MAQIANSPHANRLIIYVSSVLLCFSARTVFCFLSPSARPSELEIVANVSTVNWYTEDGLFFNIWLALCREREQGFVSTIANRKIFDIFLSSVCSPEMEIHVCPHPAFPFLWNPRRRDGWIIIINKKNRMCIPTAYFSDCCHASSHGHQIHKSFIALALIIFFLHHPIPIM